MQSVTVKKTIRSLCLVVASVLVMPVAAHASSYTGKIVSLRYGVDVNTGRISVQVSTPHFTSCSNNGIYYTFTNKLIPAEAILAALQNDKNVFILGTNTCTFGVEEIDSFDVVK